MTTFMTIPVRTLLLAVALALAAPAAGARSASTAVGTARSPGDAPTAPGGVPLDGVLIIAGIVAVVILLAWVCSRVSDSR